MGQPWRWMRPNQQKVSMGWFLAWNVLLRVLCPVETAPNAVKRHYHHHHNQNSRNLYRYNQSPPSPRFPSSSTWQNSLWDRQELPIENSFILPHPPNPHPVQNSFSLPTRTQYFPRVEPVSYNNYAPKIGWGLVPPPTIKKKQGDVVGMDRCDGKGNLLQDLGVLAIFSGAVGTFMGIFSASYYSVVGNTISIISGVLSLLTGIPSTIITYLAASDRISYTIANVLSLLSLANTAYSFWSVDFGNKDIFTSQVANAIGVFSLVLSIITAFPELFDAILYDLTNSNPDKKREIYGFVRKYGCTGGSPTFYEILQDILRQLGTL